MKAGGSGERIYFPGLVFIETKLYLAVDLNRGSCVEEVVTATAPESKKNPTEEHTTQNPFSLHSTSSSSPRHQARPSPGPLKVLLFACDPCWIPEGKRAEGFNK